MTRIILAIATVIITATTAAAEAEFKSASYTHNVSASGSVVNTTKLSAQVEDIKIAHTHREAANGTTDTTVITKSFDVSSYGKVTAKATIKDGEFSHKFSTNLKTEAAGISFKAASSDINGGKFNFTAAKSFGDFQVSAKKSFDFTTGLGSDITTSVSYTTDLFETGMKVSVKASNNGSYSISIKK